MNARNVHRKILRVRRLVRAFTLVEMLICVGAVALIAVGLGKLFSSTGDTVRIGRRLSYLNEMATTIENRIRRDLAAATRDGPMVIRHKLAGAGAGVPLSPDDRNQSPRTDRRLDEIAFLASGQFTTNREPQWPGRSASSSVARIYIGHGMVRDANDVTIPKLNDDPEDPVAGPLWPADFGAVGPNQYPSNWILLRHVTVLARPQTTQVGQLPAASGGQVLPPGLTTRMWADSPSQKDLQPAAPSVFRFDPQNRSEPDRLGFGYESRTTAIPSVVSMSRLPTPNSSLEWLRKNDATNAWPSCASGLVDIITMDPPMIRNRILAVPQRLPFDSTYNAQIPPKMTLMLPTKLSLESTNYDVNPNINPAHLQKMLMASMLPGADPWIYDYQSANLASPQNPRSGTLHEKRMICAPKPPNFAGTRLSGGVGWPVDEPYRQQDQAMLSASNLIVGCSSFKIEWSFGDVYPLYDDAAPTALQVGTGEAYRVGQVIWHGLDDGTRTPGEPPTAPYRGSERHSGTNPSTGDQAVAYDAYYQSWVPGNSTNGNALRRSTSTGLPVPFPARLIHWPTSAVDPSTEQNADVPLYSFFGYLDPTFTPRIVNGVQVDPDTLEWPWPRLLRFTIGLTDPADPTFEQTYQFIVEVPAATRRQ